MNLKKIGSLICLVTLAQNVSAMDIIPSNSNYYYPLGGGSDITMPPVTESTDITIGGNARADLNFTCDGFNPAISMGNSLNNIKDSTQGIEKSVISSVTSAVGSMPMYFLSKSNKDLYNLIQNAMASASNKFNLSTKSCQTALGEIRDGKSPYQDWFSVSDSQGWIEAVKSDKQGTPTDINNVKKQIAKDPEKYGIPWVHKDKNSGGTSGDQIPIKVVYDVVVAGYNILVSPTRNLDDDTPAPTTSHLYQYWKTPDEAGKWAQLVLGDISISSKKGADDTKRGIGLTTLVQNCPETVPTKLTCARDIAQNMVDIFKNTTNPTAEQLRSISSNEMSASLSLINAIRNKSDNDRAVAISKWSQDVALQNVVDEALLLRRILIAGSQTKPVHNLKPALNMVEKATLQLDQEIKNILFQFQVKKELMTNTAQLILRDQQYAEARATQENSQTQQPNIRNGAIYKQEN